MAKKENKKKIGKDKKDKKIKKIITIMVQSPSRYSRVWRL